MTVIENILVVEDDEIFLKTITNALRREGYQVMGVPNAQKALELAQGQQFDLIVTDVRIPGGMDGIELAQKLKGINANVKIIVIIMTGYADQDAPVRAIKVGVDDYIYKPFPLDDLLRNVKRNLHILQMERQEQKYVQEIVTMKNELEQYNLKLEDKVKEKAGELAFLYEVGRQFCASLEIQEVLPLILNKIAAILKIQKGCLFLYDESSRELFLASQKGLPPHDFKNVRIQYGEMISGWVLANRKFIRSDDTKKDERLVGAIEAIYYSGALISVPLVTNERLIGVINVCDRQNNERFTEDDVRLIQGVADQAAIAITNAQLYTSIQAEVTERKRIQEALQQSEERYSMATQGANDGLWDWNLKEDKVYYSLRWKSILGFEDHEIKPEINEWLDRVHPDDCVHVQKAIGNAQRWLLSPFEIEYRILNKREEYIWVLTRGISMGDQNIATRMAGSQTDITKRKMVEDQLRHDALHDRLTHLPNRTLFMDRLAKVIERANRMINYQFAVLFVDLDRFKFINDSFGHLVGDGLLRIVAEKLNTCVRSYDTVARFGGDEFAVLLDDIEDIKEAVEITTRIQTALSRPEKINDQLIEISASIGITANFLGTSQKPEELLRQADIAMYRVKLQGKANYGIFHKDQQIMAVRVLTLEGELRQAISRQEFCLYYQPIYSLKDASILYVEALIRWQHPTRGILMPIDFIHIAEEMGLIVKIGQWVLLQACRQLKIWQEKGIMTKVTINFSLCQLKNRDIIDYIKMILRETQTNAFSLKIELTESLSMSNTESVIDILRELQDLGIQIFIDDFGTGYSSLATLQNYLMHSLKIDRMFIKEIDKNQRNAAITKAIILMAHSLGLNVVAEGIETKEELDYLKTIGCDEGQGFFFYRPSPPEKIEQLFKAQSFCSGTQPTLPDSR